MFNKSSPGRKRSVLPRRLLVVGATLGCLCCATLPRQTNNTTVEVSGGYARAVHNTFGCGGNVTSTQINAQDQGGVAVLQELNNGMSFGASASGMREIVKEVRQYDANPTGQTHWMFGGAAFAGFHGRWIAWDIGGAYTPATFFPYASFRGGDLGRVWGELRVGAPQPILDPRMFALSLGIRGDSFIVRPWVGFIARPMHVWNWSQNQRFESDRFGTVSNGPDLAGGLDASLSVSEEVDVFFQGVAAEAPSAALGLRIHLPND